MPHLHVCAHTYVARRPHTHTAPVPQRAPAPMHARSHPCAHTCTLPWPHVCASAPRTHAPAPVRTHAPPGAHWAAAHRAMSRRRSLQSCCHEAGRAATHWPYRSISRPQYRAATSSAAALRGNEERGPGRAWVCPPTPLRPRPALTCHLSLLQPRARQAEATQGACAPLHRHSNGGRPRWSHPSYQGGSFLRTRSWGRGIAPGPEAEVRCSLAFCRKMAAAGPALPEAEVDAGGL